MGLELKVEQKQRVYQKQIEQARILQMNAQELAVCIQEAALENPLIELEEMMDVPIEELVKKDVRETDEAEVSEDTDWRYTGGHQSPEDWWTPQGGKSESLVDMIHQQLLTMSIGEKEKEIVEKLAGALDSRGYLEIPVKKTGKIYTMFGAGTSECIRDTQIIGTGRNRRGRFEGMSDSAVETAERLPACGYIGQKLSGRLAEA